MTAGSRIAAANIQDEGGYRRGEISAVEFFFVFLGYAWWRYPGVKQRIASKKGSIS
jgi:hypothetical protein